MSLTFVTEHRADAAVVHLVGRIDRDAGAELDAAFASAGGPVVVELDFAGVDYINSSGIALIVGVLTLARAGGVTIRATNLTPHYRHIFEITRLDDFIEVVRPAEPLKEGS